MKSLQTTGRELHGLVTPSPRGLQELVAGAPKGTDELPEKTSTASREASTTVRLEQAEMDVAAARADAEVWKLDAARAIAHAEAAVAAALADADAWKQNASRVTAELAEAREQVAKAREMAGNAAHAPTQSRQLESSIDSLRKQNDELESRLAIQSAESRNHRIASIKHPQSRMPYPKLELPRPPVRIILEEAHMSWNVKLEPGEYEPIDYTTDKVRRFSKAPYYEPSVKAETSQADLLDKPLKDPDPIPSVQNWADPEEVQASLSAAVPAQGTPAASPLGQEGAGPRLLLQRQRSLITDGQSSAALADSQQNAWLLPITQNEWQRRQSKSPLLIKFNSDGRPCNPIGRTAALPLTNHDPPLTTHPSPPTTHSLLTTHHSPLTTHHSPLTTHHSLLTTHHSPLTTHHSPLTTHHSPLTTHHPPLTTHSLLIDQVPLAVSNVPLKHGFLALRACAGEAR